MSNEYVRLSLASSPRVDLFALSAASRFEGFLTNIALTDAQKVAGSERREAVVRVMNSHYYGITSGSANSKFVGSWGKLTRVRPPRDVDILFVLPLSVYNRFELRIGNRQSQILQEIKGVLAERFSTTAIKGSGPVVVVPFSAYNVELVPVFELTSGQYWICNTSSGGRYQVADYDAEAELIRTSNSISKGNTRNLI
ncbi:SMODS domain-containing nucleotidyltransferase [Loktanella sp. DJP18]|uniref:SMODS domain-containing nucleotidyltransferase n=1 Tax=Loktanella sp. DJP18 TaxID=3409788 RepID=UPI003BB57206